VQEQYMMLAVAIAAHTVTAAHASVVCTRPRPALMHRSCLAMQSPPPPPAPSKSLEGFVSSLIQVAEDAGKAASEAADQWVNSGWQVKKRAGKVIPEIRPNSPNVGNNAVQYFPTEGQGEKVEQTNGAAIQVGLAGPSGSLAEVEKQASSILTTGSSVDLASEFSTYLVPMEGKSYRTTPKGEIVFESREALAALVADFSYAKLRELAAAARALSRYVDDIEGELEAADDAVVGLNRQLTEQKKLLGDAERSKQAVQARADDAMRELDTTKSSLLERQQALADAERAAERAAGQVLELQSKVSAEAAASNDEMVARAVQLENELMGAETAAEELAHAKAKLEETVNAMLEQQTLAAEAQRQEEERVAELAAQAAAAESAAEAKAKQLSSELERSEASVAALQAQLKDLKSSLAAGAVGGAAEGVAVLEGGDAVEGGMAEATEALTRQIEEQLRGTGLLPEEGAAAATKQGGASVVTIGSAAPAPCRPPLSRMKKAELAAECNERKLPSDGSVAELRAQLRVERKRDTMVDELLDRGWNEKQARAALAKTNWDVDEAIASLS